MQVSALLVPSLVLHTVGAKSGEPRDAALMYTPDGQGRAIVAGTNFAGARHPAWTTNLLAHPDAAITVRGRRMPVHATPVPDAERDAVWARIEAQWPGYRNYERESGRTVRLFRLQPVRAERTDERLRARGAPPFADARSATAPARRPPRTRPSPRPSWWP